MVFSMKFNTIKHGGLSYVFRVHKLLFPYNIVFVSLWIILVLSKGTDTVYYLPGMVY